MAKKNTNPKIKKPLNDRFFLVRVGSNDRPAGPTDIKDTQDALTELMKRMGIEFHAFVTHHAIKIETIFVNH